MDGNHTAGSKTKRTHAQSIAQVANLRLRFENSLYIATLEMGKGKLSFDLAFDFTEKALSAIETLRIMDATGTIISAEHG